MTPDDYQYRALATALPAALDAVYLTLGLCGEAGEVAELLKKSIRDGEKADHADRLRRELGDVLWYVAVLAHVHGMTLEEVMAANVAKLSARKATGNLGGSGDYRGEVDDRARLEARVRALEAECAEARAEAAKWAAELDGERAAVVAWLRHGRWVEKSVHMRHEYDTPVSSAIHDAADIIERGEHRAGGAP